MHLIGVLFIATILIASSFGQLSVKHLGGPAEEFPLHNLPDPVNIFTSERSYYIPVWFNTPDSSNVVYSIDFPVDGPSDFLFTFASPHASSVELELFDPSGKVVDIQTGKVESFYPIGLSVQIPVTAYMVKNSLAGVYKLNLKTDLSLSKIEELQHSVYPNAALTLFNNDYIEIQTHLSSFIIKAGEPIGLVSTVVDNSPSASVTNIEITSAQLEVFSPDGSEIEVPMTDDVDFLGVPKNSGTYGAEIPAKIPGQYLLQAKLAGTYQDATLNTQVQFIRTTQHFIDVSSATVELAGTARLRNKDSETALIDISVTDVASAQPRLRAYAQVWGVDPKTKSSVPAAWIGGLVDLTQQTVTLELNLKWLQRAGVTGPLTLKGVYLSDIGKSFPVAKFEGDITVTGSDSLSLELTEEMRTMEITKQMRFGANPLNLNTSLALKTGLVLSGGYCSDNPWARSTTDFTNAYYPVFNGNFAHDEYSQKIVKYAESQKLDTWGVIGHSQGGALGTHIRNYYWTGLDLSTGARKIQSVGTPFKGCSGAGSAANLIKIFGVGCGANNDLTVEGSTLWLGGISLESRKGVFFYTTTYKLGNLFGDYCNMIVNTILAWPNDGTTELENAVLTGGTNLGNTEKQCHIASMAYPAQYDDHTRNKLMNGLAAR